MVCILIASFNYYTFFPHSVLLNKIGSKIEVLDPTEHIKTARLVTSANRGGANLVHLRWKNNTIYDFACRLAIYGSDKKETRETSSS